MFLCIKTTLKVKNLLGTQTILINLNRVFFFKVIYYFIFYKILVLNVGSRETGPLKFEMRLLMLGLDNAGKTTVLLTFCGDDIFEREVCEMRLLPDQVVDYLDDLLKGINYRDCSECGQWW